MMANNSLDLQHLSWHWHQLKVKAQLSFTVSVNGPQTQNVTQTNVVGLQVQWAFLAGLAVVIALIPLNRCLAGVIQRASQRMMAAKDERIRLIGELLHGIRQIKLAAWEPFFVAKVRTHDL